MSSISECKNNGDCIINKKNRTSCKSCRLRKCLLVGMSKSGSRYGRRSNWFKIHCLLQEQGSSVNSQNGLNPNFIGPNGASLYPGLFNTRHMLNSDKFLEARLNSFSPFSDSKHFLQDLEKYRTSSEDSGGSSAGDIEDESRSTSVTSRGPPHSHQTPSPISDKDTNQKKLSITLPSSPCTTAPSPFTSPQSQNIYTSPYVSPPLRPIHQLPVPFAVTRPGVAPATNNLIFLDTLGTPSWSIRSGGDLLLCSPAPGGIAVEQDQPIDLSVKSCISDSPQQPSSRSSTRSPQSPIDDREDDRDIKSVHVPLDLTSKRHQELTTHFS